MFLSRMEIILWLRNLIIKHFTSSHLPKSLPTQVFLLFTYSQIESQLLRDKMLTIRPIEKEEEEEKKEEEKKEEGGCVVL